MSRFSKQAIGCLVLLSRALAATPPFWVTADGKWLTADGTTSDSSADAAICQVNDDSEFVCGNFNVAIALPPGELKTIVTSSGKTEEGTITGWSVDNDGLKLVWVTASGTANFYLDDAGALWATFDGTPGTVDPIAVLSRPAAAN